MKDTSGNFLMPVLVSGCGAQDSSNYSGLANLNFAPNGISLVLHLTGFFIAGTGRDSPLDHGNGIFGIGQTCQLL
jgi:hypothetical protein